MRSKALVLAAGLAIAPLAGAEPSASVQREIDHLIRYVGNSGCEFERNGAWSDARTAEAHVRSKYDFLLAMDRIHATQDFIDKAATESSLSGQPYEIRCGGDARVPTGAWLSSELARYRASRH